MRAAHFDQRFGYFVLLLPLVLAGTALLLMDMILVLAGQGSWRDDSVKIDAGLLLLTVAFLIHFFGEWLL